MRLYAKFLATMALVAVAALGGWLCWTGFRLPVRAKTSSTTSTSTPTESSAAQQTPGAFQTTADTAPAAAAGPAWSETIDTALNTGVNDGASAQMLLNVLPRLPVAGQVEAAQHIVNLLPDENYASLGHYLTNTALAADVREVMFNDLLNRPNSIKLSWLLAVARTPGHDEAAEAKDTLEVFLGEDYGTDWTAWSEKVRVWLQNNPG